MAAGSGVAVVCPHFKHAVSDIPESQADFAARVFSPILAVQGQGDIAIRPADKDLVAADRDVGQARMQRRCALFRRSAVSLDVGRGAQRLSPGALYPAVRLSGPQRPDVVTAPVNAPSVFRLAPFLRFIDQSDHTRWPPVAPIP